MLPPPKHKKLDYFPFKLPRPQKQSADKSYFSTDAESPGLRSESSYEEPVCGAGDTTSPRHYISWKDVLSELNNSNNFIDEQQIAANAHQNVNSPD